MPIISKRKLITNVAALHVAAAGGGGGTSTNTWNPLDAYPYLTFSNVNKTITKHTGSFFASTRALDSASSGKYYWEIHIDILSGTGPHGYGIANAAASLTAYAGQDNGMVGWAEDGNIFYNNGFISNIQGYVQGNTICLAWDAGNKKIWFRTNGGNWNNAAIGSQDPASNIGGTNLATLDAGPYFALATLNALGDAATVNFGATAFAQTMPSGFTRWP